MTLSDMDELGESVVDLVFELVVDGEITEEVVFVVVGEFDKVVEDVRVPE